MAPVNGSAGNRILFSATDVDLISDDCCTRNAESISFQRVSKRLVFPEGRYRRAFCTAALFHDKNISESRYLSTMHITYHQLTPLMDTLLANSKRDQIGV